MEWQEFYRISEILQLKASIYTTEYLVSWGARNNGELDNSKVTSHIKNSVYKFNNISGSYEGIVF